MVGMVLLGSKSDQGWNESHFVGLDHACREHGCALKVHEHVPEEEAALAGTVDELAGEGVNVICLTSLGYGKYVDRIAERYPNIVFYSVSGQGTARNCTPYFARMYQVRYLSGIVAGAASRTGIVGYVTALPDAQTNRGINAFALGMRVANPKARLLVCFTGSWRNEIRERKCVSLLASEGADVLTYHEDKPYVVQEAEEQGLFSIGYNDVREEYSERFLTAALYDWNVVYKKILDDYLSGRRNVSSDYWIGLSMGGVRLYPLSPLVSAETAALVEREKERIMTSRDVYSGLIYDNTGNIRCEEGERISDSELFNGMDWFVEGVEIYE